MPHGNDPVLPGTLAVPKPAGPARGAPDAQSRAASIAGAVRACLVVPPFLAEIEELYADVDSLFVMKKVGENVVEGC